MSGPSLKLFFQATAASEREILFDSFPLEVGKHFCPTIKARMANQNSTLYVLSGTSKVATGDILRWMTACFAGNGEVKFMPDATATLEGQHHYLELAKELDVPAFGEPS